MARLTRQFVFFLILFIFDARVSRSFPREWLDYDSDAIEDYDEGIQSRTDGKIVFPSEDVESEPSPFTTTELLLTPTCQNSTFCESIPNYPTNLVETSLRMNQDFKQYAKVDYIPDIVHRANMPDDVALCESEEKVVYPKLAQSKDNKWHYIVNQADFAQGVRVEICEREDTTCNLIDGLIEGYTTLCKQKFVYRELIAILPKGQFKRDLFRFPSSCCCHIKFTGDPSARIGVATAKKNTSLHPMEHRNLASNH